MCTSGYGKNQGQIRAYSWTHAGGTVDLGSLLPDSYPRKSEILWLAEALAVSNGQVVGWTYACNPDNCDNTLAVHPFSWTQAGGMVDVGTLPGQTESAVTGVSNGQVVGTSGSHAFSWTQAGGMVDLGPVGVSAVSNGQVVGNAGGHAFSWTQAGGMVDLGTLPGGTSSSATAVSNGQVVGNADTGSGANHAALWMMAPACPR